MRRTLREAIEIAAGHRTPADKLEREFRDRRKCEAFAQRRCDREHETLLNHRTIARRKAAGESEYPPGITTNTVGAANGGTVAGPGMHENDMLKRIQSVFDGQVTGLSASNGRVGTIACAGGGSVPVPEWANWLAIDEDGHVYLHECCPVIEDRARYWFSVYPPDQTQMESITKIGYRPDWRDTLCPLTEKAWKEWSA